MLELMTDWFKLIWVIQVDNDIEVNNILLLYFV